MSERASGATTVRTLALVTLAAAALSCAGRASPHSAFELRDTQHNEILLLHGNIIQYRKDIGLPDQPDRNLIQRLHNHPIEQPPAQRPEGMSDQCTDVCDLADRICQAQEDICRISDELGSDDQWAQEKCDSAKASCKEAKKRCTDCK